MNQFGHWLRCKRLICKITFWQNKSFACSVKCCCFVGRPPVCSWSKMKTKQNVPSALRLFLSPRSSYEMLIAALEIWPLLRLTTNCSKKTTFSIMKHKVAPALNGPEFTHNSSVIFMTLHLPPSSSLSSSLDTISHHHQFYRSGITKKYIIIISFEHFVVAALEPLLPLFFW